VFDDIVAYSVNPSESVDIMDNGNAIVSINTDGSGTGVIMSGSACNTYQNKTTYGKNTVTMNGNTRYYYNLDTIRSGSPSDAEKLLLWSVQQYAHSSIAGYNYFGTSFTPSGTTLDMTGLSYYTIDHANSFLFSNRNFSLTFYNKEIETGESGTGNTDNNPRNTVSKSSQHYMMHCGLFRNAPANSLTLGSVTLSGNVGKYNGGSGFIISGKLGGDASVTSQFSDTGITLNGAYIYTGDNAIAAGSYAPLLFNSVGKNADLKIKNVSTSGYTSFSGYAASSLIGKVGADDASDSNMNIEFSGATLDARKPQMTFQDRILILYMVLQSLFSVMRLCCNTIFTVVQIPRACIIIAGMKTGQIISIMSPMVLKLTILLITETATMLVSNATILVAISILILLIIMQHPHMAILLQNASLMLPTSVTATAIIFTNFVLISQL